MLVTIGLYDFDFVTPRVYCLAINANNFNRFYIISFILIANELWLLVLSYALRWRNRRYLAKLHSAALNIRYQLTENVRSLSLFIILLWLHVVVFVTNSIGLILVRYIVDIADTFSLIVYNELFSIIFLYPLAHLTILYAIRRVEQKRVNRLITMNTMAKENHQQKRHFDELRKSWMWCW